MKIASHTRFIKKRTVLVRTGVTLLEILLATVILAMSLAAISQLANTGVNAGLRTQQESEAALLCESQLDRLLTGVDPLRNTQRETVSQLPHWNWSCTVEDVDPRLLRVTVLVESSAGLPSASCELTQLVLRAETDR